MQRQRGRIKTYDVTIIEKGIPEFKSIIRVTTDKHPGPQAINFICKYGYKRVPDYQRIIKIEKIE